MSNNGDVTINGGNITLEGSARGINAEKGNLTINGGIISATGNVGIQCYSIAKYTGIAVDEIACL